ncbi:hypothetical protein K0817_012675 [Microbacterium sp. HD4P20]|uniref:hypothetical protein n=1 Tax=Microbacterium sp. HD4P20 TaxID=2864874 RepID=UPI001C63C881|nr:hypothetical protein [Microbacterium sp. HD4P20]MCP2637409.1 hypothetical protein [Microbacterium sp. HD4P20]
MQELLGRLTALDPQASETLKVVSYFDALVASGVGAESLVRSAAALTGVPVGLRMRGRMVRVGSDGRSLAPQPAASHGWLSRDAGDDAIVWIERDGAPHANDAMVLERLALALAITTARRASDGAGAMEIALSTHATDEERGTALARLHLDTEPLMRAVALPPDADVHDRGPSAIVVTPRGLARALLCRAGQSLQFDRRAGLGIPLPPDRLAESWASALFALRLTTDANPIVDASELGAVLLLAEVADGHSGLHPDAAALATLDQRAIDVLDAFADTGSVRAAATKLGKHHSSVQEKITALAQDLGYDPRTTAGRTRYSLARTLLQLSHPGLTA